MNIRTWLIALGFALLGQSSYAQENEGDVVAQLMREGTPAMVAQLIQEGAAEACTFDVEVTDRKSEKTIDVSPQLKLHMIDFDGRWLDVSLTPKTDVHTEIMCERAGKDFKTDLPSFNDLSVSFISADDAMLPVPSKIRILFVTGNTPAPGGGWEFYFFVKRL